VAPTDGTPGVIMRATFYGTATIALGYIRPKDVAPSPSRVPEPSDLLVDL
jgi:hypothetical protein